MPKPPKVPGKQDVLRKLLEQYTRIEVGLRTGFFHYYNTKPKGGLSLANDMVDIMDKMRKLVFGTSDIFELADKFGFKLKKRKK